MDPDGTRTSTRATLLAATGQNRCPPAGSYMAATGQDLMAADTTTPPDRVPTSRLGAGSLLSQPERSIRAGSLSMATLFAGAATPSGGGRACGQVHCCLSRTRCSAAKSRLSRSEPDRRTHRGPQVLPSTLGRAPRPPAGCPRGLNRVPTGAVNTGACPEAPGRVPRGLNRVPTGAVKTGACPEAPGGPRRPPRTSSTP